MPVLERITDSIYAHTEGKTIGNVGVIATETGNFIVDTSMYPIMAREIRGELENIKSGRVKAALMTHYHFDHIGGNQVFHDVPIYAHQYINENIEKSYMEGKIEKMLEERDDKEMFIGLEVTKPTVTFETSPFYPTESDQIEIYQVGGHTNGSSLVFYKEEQALFAGDNLFAGLFPWGGDPTASPYDWMKAMDVALELQPKYIIPGHGPVQTTIKELEKLNEYLKTVVKLGKNLKTDGVSQEDALSSLLEVDHHPEHREGLKVDTLKHWVGQIYDH
ncbi:MAG: MBL fold metallo-hydrolase [Candidatus Kariarchaeaceae archaeon]|jgi:glyoxylase-like metal-dependent hydrolase (beta-lactamase superfamily II)